MSTLMQGLEPLGFDRSIDHVIAVGDLIDGGQFSTATWSINRFFSGGQTAFLERLSVCREETYLDRSGILISKGKVQMMKSPGR